MLHLPSEIPDNQETLAVRTGLPKACRDRPVAPYKGADREDGRGDPDGEPRRLRAD